MKRGLVVFIVGYVWGFFGALAYVRWLLSMGGSSGEAP